MMAAASGPGPLWGLQQMRSGQEGPQCSPQALPCSAGGATMRESLFRGERLSPAATFPLRWSRPQGSPSTALPCGGISQPRMPAGSPAREGALFSGVAVWGFQGGSQHWLDSTLPIGFIRSQGGPVQGFYHWTSLLHTRGTCHWRLPGQVWL